MSPTLALWWALAAAPAHASPAADELVELLELGRTERARARCRPEARSAGADPVVRELCARAYWSDAVRADTVEGWADFRARWVGTSSAAEASLQEARAALRDLGELAPESAYADWLARYGDTGLVPRASALAARAALREVEDASDAAAVIARWPGNPGLVDLVARFPADLVTIALDGDSPVASVAEGVPLTEPPTARWVSPGPSGPVAWADAAAAHAASLGLPASGLPEAWLPCPTPDLPLGVEIAVAEVTVVVPHAGLARCDVGPTFAIVRDGHLVAVSAGPDATALLAVPGEPFGPWSPDTRVPLVGDPEAAGLRSGTIVQPIGGLALVTPLSGGLPYYTPYDAEGVAPLPDGRTVRDRLPPGPSEPPWALPDGEPRVLWPVFTLASGLHVGGGLAARPSTASPLDPKGRPAPGSAPLPVEVVPWREVRALTASLEALGLPIAASRAWRVELGPGAPRTFFDGAWRGRPVRGVVDESGGAPRVWVWVAPVGADLRAFQLRGRSWVVWRNPDGATDLLHEEAGALIRDPRSR